MKTPNLLISVLFAALLALAGFGAAAAPHDCAAHCAKHTDKDAKMCLTHCTTGAAAGHDCAAHCASQSSDDLDNACALHCAAAK
ncbi:MAG: hypothetical protein ACRERV_16575 [Methylococcales bacterium]